jgi:site-specific DNA-methyltransferase (adenine-specific)
VKSNLAVHFSSKSNDWATPQWLFDELNAKYGPLALDVCSSNGNGKCPFNIEYPRSNGLELSWTKFGNRTAWMNPPYGREIGKWVKKAYEESQKGCLVVCLLPSRTDTKWFHNYIYNKQNVAVQFISGRLKFGAAVNSAPFPSMVVVFNPPKEKA